jgi:hypothetical protein
MRWPAPLSALTVPLAAVAAALLAATPAAAMDRFEIQVYDAEIGDPGEASLEAHLNVTPRGLRAPEYPGALPPDRLGRLTLEPAIGVTPWLGLGAYLQGVAGPGGLYRYGGFKLRAKLVVPEATRQAVGLPVFLGLSAEVAHVPHELEEAPWTTELRPIIGWRGARWLVSFNPIVGWALTGHDALRPDLDPCGKVAWDTRRGVAVGLEYYAGLGAAAGAFSPGRAREQLLLAVLDLAPAAPPGEPAAESPWELDLGAGLGLTAVTGQHLVVKAIVGRSF